MIFIKDEFIKKLKLIAHHPNRNLWLTVLSALLLNIIFNLHLIFSSYFRSLNVNDYYFQWLFFPLDNVRYGHYLAKKLYLPIIAFVLLFFFIIKRVKIFQFLKENLFQIIFILLALFFSRFYSFQHWFFLDDYRFLEFKYLPFSDIQYVPCCGDLYTTQALMMIVMEWFGLNFNLYNFLGLVIYFFIGFTIYLICLKLQKSKQVALLVSLFFVTVPTYFYATMAMVDFIGDGSALLLFAISLYFLIVKSYAHALIFALASLEFGLSRSHMIPVPFILTALFFAEPKERKKILVMSLLLIISVLPYLPLILFRSGSANNELKLVNYFFNPEYLTHLLNMLTHVIFPYSFLSAIISLLNSLYASNYLTPALGLIVLISLIYFTVSTYIKKYYITSKLIIIGTSLLLLSVIFPPIVGVRNDPRVMEYTKETMLAFIPSPTTGYGHFSALGLVLILIGVLLVVKNSSIIKRVLVVLIIIDSLSFISADYKWHKLISYKQRNINEQLNSVLPRDGKAKVILLTMTGKNAFHEIDRFHNLYRPTEKMALFETQQAWEEYKKLNSPNIKQIYLFSYDDNDSEQKLINLSDAYRNGKYQKWWGIE